MKTKFIILLALITNLANAQLRPAKDITAGAILGSEATAGFHMQASNFYFQTKFSTQHRPDHEGYDHTHTHNLGMVFKITNKIEVLNAVGYNSLWNGTNKKLEWHYSFGMAFRDEVIKLAAFTDWNHDYSIGIFFSF